MISCRGKLILIFAAALSACGGDSDRDGDAIDRSKDEDRYLNEVKEECERASSNDTIALITSCAKYDVLKSFESFLRGDHRIGDHVKLIHVNDRQVTYRPRSNEDLHGLIGYLERKSRWFATTTDVELTFTPEVTEGLPAPRFIDEVYSEFQTIDYKNSNNKNKSQLQKLFIPLLIILKLFKLKLLLLLPLILGVASFKKLIGLMLILIPGVIGYLKLCRSSYDYGVHGHSSYYDRPSSIPHRKSSVETNYYSKNNHPYHGYY